MLDVHKDYRIRESHFLNDIRNKSEITLRDIIGKRNICRGTSRYTNESAITHRNSRNLFVTLFFIFHLIVIVIQTYGKNIVYIKAMFKLFTIIWRSYSISIDIPTNILLEEIYYPYKFRIFTTLSQVKLLFLDILDIFLLED